MAWWRTLLKVICSVLLLASLILFIVSLSFGQAFSYDNLKPVFIEEFKEQMEPINEQELADFHSMLVQNCSISGAETIDVPFSGGPEVETIALKCSDVIANTPSSLIDLVGEGAFNEIYYKEYDCSFIDCITEAEDEEKMLVFMSEFASQSFRRISNIFLIAVILFIILMALLCVPKYTIFMGIGINFIVAGLPFFITNFMKAGMPLPEEAMLIFGQLFSYLSTYFLTVLITGIILLVIGIIVIFWQKKKLARKIQKQEKKPEKEEKNN